MKFAHRAEWEWGWKTPLLLRFKSAPPPEIRHFLSIPLDEISLGMAEATFEKRTAELKTSRIGIRFERVQEALFRAHPDTESLRTGLVVPGRTEIDLLHRLRSLPKTIIHWEVAVKYYLGLDDGGAADPDRFIGPSLKDTLGLKLRAIYGRQLRILEDPEIRAAYGDEFGIADDDRILQLPKVHGILYHPFRGRNECFTPPEVDAAGVRGAWTALSDLQEFLDSFRKTAFSRVRLLADRREWIRDQSLADAEIGCETELKCFLNSPLETRIQRHFSEKSEPVHLALVGEPGDPGDFRFFIVPNDWRLEAERKLETLRSESRIKP